MGDQKVSDCSPDQPGINAVEDANTVNEDVNITLEASGGLTETDVVTVAVNDNEAASITSRTASALRRST